MRYNCRFYKEDINGEKILKIKVASTKRVSSSCFVTTFFSQRNFGEVKVGEVKVRIEKGLYAKILGAVCIHLKSVQLNGTHISVNSTMQAIEHASTFFEKGMLWKYCDHFQEGDWKNRRAAHVLSTLAKNSIVRSDFSFDASSRASSSASFRNFWFSS